MEITKEFLESKLAEGLSGNQIGKLLGITGTGVRFHLKKYGLQSNFQSFKDKDCYRTETHKQCPKCSEIKELKDFDKRANGDIQSYCRECFNDNRYTLLKQHKRTLVEEFGGCCSICGYNKNYSALEFHHLESKEKDFHLGSAKTTNIDKLRKEVEKCILVCSNCHKELHYPQNQIKDS